MNRNINIIGIIILFVTFFSGCKKDNSNNNNNNGLTPSANNTNYEQTLQMKVNGIDWIPTMAITGNRMVALGNDVTQIAGRKDITSSNSETLTIGMIGPNTTGSFDVRANSGTFQFAYNYLPYIFAYNSPSTNKGHLVVEILSEVKKTATSSTTYLSANFSGVVYNPYDADDSVIITEGKLRFK